MTSTTTRLDAMDSAKGIGIVLVVFGHAWRGAEGAGLLPDQALFRLVDFGIYAFHMPLFFFLSGLLFLETLQKYGTRTLMRGRLTRLLWPMALWTWIFFGLKLVAGQSPNNPVNASDFPVIPLPPYEHLWFLWALFICQSLLILGYALVPDRVAPNVWRWLCAIVAVIWAGLNPFIPVPSLIWGPMFEHFPYFLVGIAAGGLVGHRLPPFVGVVCALGFAVLMWAVQGEKASVLHSFALVLLAWGAWLCVDRGAGGRAMAPLLNGLRFLGRASMVIYLTHTVFSAALRIAMLKYGTSDVIFLLAATLAIGLVGPLILGRVATRLRATKLLGF